MDENPTLQVSDNSHATRLTEEIGPSQATSISQEEYQVIMDTLRELKDELKASKAHESTLASKPSIDEQVAREIAQNEKRELTQKELAEKAKFISEVNKLSEENLASQFNTEKLERQGYATNEIVDAQIKALVKKFVPQETILAIAGTSDLEKVNRGSELLNQLFRVSKASIKERKNRHNSYRALHNELTASEGRDLKSFENNGANLLAEDDFKYANLNYWKQRRDETNKHVF
ncbi:DUF1357 family protein [Borrelia sp. P9F1]|uniref:DUF1357 family protein n=1 Tax=Borrelia sp. P9F1 TaxID=3058374 RepID=UPI0026489662|nr:DUF1357 family protein [Borrelia sp. P9F1]WKC58489.1 DUF1357 family protein [Borrelia sp. P9F1]